MIVLVKVEFVKTLQMDITVIVLSTIWMYLQAEEVILEESANDVSNSSLKKFLK